MFAHSTNCILIIYSIINIAFQTAGLYILKFKEALPEAADLRRRRDFERFTLNSYTIAEWKYSDFGPMSRKLKHKRCIIKVALVKILVQEATFCL